ncbi:MAG: ABC transporter ATP-binding protein [Lachnospiraceae bacterium]|jgi:iron complex transport system ATP-binding protein|nr:ABC transporter ATP-binding protein [Lachnospiraceae bacterium]
MAQTHRITIDRLVCGYGQRAVTGDVSFGVEPGEIVCILGPNGVGKTTFFRTVQGFLPKISGGLKINGREIGSYKRKELAKLIAYVPQAQVTAFPYSVRDVTVMGRTAHFGTFSTPGKKDYEICDEVIDRLGITPIKDKQYTQISGGERQMTIIARALAQKSRFLMMDEPTNNLDFGNQVKVLQHILALAKEGIGILMTTHFPEHAFLCSNKVALFARDKRFVCGTSEEIVTEETMQETYGVKVRVAGVPGLTEDERIKVCTPVL